MDVLNPGFVPGMLYSTLGDNGIRNFPFFLLDFFLLMFSVFIDEVNISRIFILQVPSDNCFDSELVLLMEILSGKAEKLIITSNPKNDRKIPFIQQ